MLARSRAQGGYVHIQARIENLEPNSTHGFHIHQDGDITSHDGTATGDHFNPDGVPHACPNDTTTPWSA